MAKLSRTIDKLNKKYLTESTDNEAIEAAKALLDLFHMFGINQFKQLDSDKKYIVVRCPGGEVLLSVHGFKNGTLSKGKHTAITDEPTKLKLKSNTPPAGAVEESEETVNTNINSDPNVQQAQLNALQRLQQKLQQQKNVSSAAGNTGM